MWTCPKCGAQVDDLYASCWSCNADQPVERGARDEAAGETTADLIDRAQIRPWTCSKCGTRVDAGFDTCWSCGTSIDGVEDPNFVTADEIVPDEEDQEDDEPPAQPQTTCPRCWGLMVRGSIVEDDAQKPSQTSTPRYWVEEPASEVSVRMEVRAYRCSACGYLEFYAARPE